MMETINIGNVELTEEQVRFMISDAVVLHGNAVRSGDQEEITSRFAILNRWQAVHQVMLDN